MVGGVLPLAFCMSAYLDWKIYFARLLIVIKITFNPHWSEKIIELAIIFPGCPRMKALKKPSNCFTLLKN